MHAEIIAIGSELLTPFRSDTNSLFLTGRLNSAGVEVAFKTIVGDTQSHLVLVAKTAFARAEIVIFMGGLGPTEDDLTRECVAEALALPLIRDNEILTELYKRFASRRLQMAPNNAKQADILEGAEILPNAKGTAPGQWLKTVYESQPRIAMLLPGPPHELEPLFDAECMPRLKAALPARAIATRELKVAMMGESACDAKVAPIYKKYKDVQTTILADAGEIQLHLRASAEKPEDAQKRVDALANELEDELDESVFASAGETLEQIVGYFLQLHNATVAVAESCTGGLVAQRITSVSGSSRYFLGGAIVYSNELKTQFADVPPLLIAEKGAVSREVAIAMAEGIRKRCKATLGVGVTGIAGPTGGTDDKPVGLVYHAVSDGKRTEVVERRFMGDRDRIRRWAAQQALDMVRKFLM